MRWYIVIERPLLYAIEYPLYRGALTTQLLQDTSLAERASRPASARIADPRNNWDFQKTAGDGPETKFPHKRATYTWTKPSTSTHYVYARYARNHGRKLFSFVCSQVAHSALESCSLGSKKTENHSIGVLSLRRLADTEYVRGTQPCTSYQITCTIK